VASEALSEADLAVLRVPTNPYTRYDIFEHPRLGGR